MVAAGAALRVRRAAERARPDHPARSARVVFARSLFSAVEEGRVPRSDLTADLDRQMHNLKDRALEEQIARAWGTDRETSPDCARLIAPWKAALTARQAWVADPWAGRSVFARACQQCHTLFGEGGGSAWN